MAFLHSAQLLYTDCGYPRWSVCFTLPNAIFFYMLFNDFYKVSKLITIACSGMQGQGTWHSILCWQSVGMVSGSPRPWLELHGIINNDEFYNFFPFSSLALFLHRHRLAPRNLSATRRNPTQRRVRQRQRPAQTERSQMAKQTDT